MMLSHANIQAETEGIIELSSGVLNATHCSGSCRSFTLWLSGESFLPPL